MSLSGILKITPGTKRLITLMAILSVIALLVAWWYYSRINRYEDPRVIEAKKLFVESNNLVKEGELNKALSTLDVIDSIYASEPCYANSYERGVVCNNRASIYINFALYRYQNDEGKRLHSLDSAEVYVRKAMTIYKDWLKRVKGKNRAELTRMLKPCFTTVQMHVEEPEKYLIKRVEEIEQAQYETKRRLSVSYSNLGIIQRHKRKLDEALASFKKAIDLWPKNHEAKNNLNVLMGKKRQKRSVLDQLFPGERTKH
jgi:tetratricopeptide (TPR) repeat protein